jgi:hypothetical protein
MMLYLMYSRQQYFILYGVSYLSNRVVVHAVGAEVPIRGQPGFDHGVSHRLDTCR